VTGWRIDEYGLGVRQPVPYGGWCFREPFVGFQDNVIATKVRHVH
jgi:hypothetical protein